ncbi:toprim domain-containing protein [candidate division WWE3 bacterium]|nr:toprim domain-containing protein [candidate division WWE3 bacterium]
MQQDYNKLNKQPSEFLDEWKIEYDDKGKELVLACLFSDCDSEGNTKHLYMDADTGQFWCHKCHKKGNLVTVAEHLNLNPSDLFEKPKTKTVRLKSGRKVELKAEPKSEELLEKASSYHNNLSVEQREYLNKRGITNATVDTRLIGESEIYGVKRITLPVFDKNGNVISIKARVVQELEEATDAKYVYFPTGAKASLYGLDLLEKSISDFAIISEGEFDSLILSQWGYTSVSSTGGAGTFSSDWVLFFDNFQKIYFCYDNDKAGKEGAIEHAKKFKNKKVFIVEIPQIEGVKDVTEFATVAGNTKEDFELLLKNAKEYNPYSPEFLNLEFGEPIKEFIPSQFYDADTTFFTIPLNIKNNEESPFRVITSNKELYTLDEVKDKFNYKIVRNPDFMQRWSSDGVRAYLSGKGASSYNITLQELVSFLKQYVDLSNENWYLVIALWLWGTYFYRIFNSYPYFNVNGLMGCGKSKLLEVGSFLAFNGEFLVTSTPAFVIDCINDNCATLFLDEVENLKNAANPDTQTMVQMLNSGYKKGPKKGKKDPSGKGKGWNSIKLDPYSPKMIAGIKNISDTLISRSINMTMVLSNNNEIKNKELSESDTRLSSYRDTFYYSAMELHTDIKDIYNQLTETEVFGRNWEVWRPLFCIALALNSQNPESEPVNYNKVRTFALEIIKNQSGINAENQSTIQMLVAFREMMVRDQRLNNFYTMSQLKTFLLDNHGDYFDWLGEFKESGISRYIGDELRKTGIVTEAAKAVKIDGKTQRGFILDRNLIERRLKAYGIEFGVTA